MRKFCWAKFSQYSQDCPGNTLAVQGQGAYMLYIYIVKAEDLWEKLSHFSKKLQRFSLAKLSPFTV